MVEAAAHVGLYQLFFLDDVAAFAAVHETVEASKRLAGDRAARFINALLRRAQREMPLLRANLDAQPPAVRRSHPDDLLRRWEKNFGPGNAERLCAWNNTRAETWIRRRPGHVFEKLPRGRRVTEMEGYAEGAFMVQDPATMLAVDLLDVKPGHRVLDACAAPGGKTVAIADRLEGKGSVLALDRHDDRIALLEENVGRARCDFVRVQKGDASGCEWSERFDRILLDVPCSNTGVIRRRPDIRWRFSERRLARLARTQAELLDHVARALAPGGRLVYSTCSLEPEENESLVAAWLASHHEFTLIEERRSFPPDSGMDGAYAAALLSSATAPRIRT
jgi:16S rRNA (cytosine967-C5)-methyltransferase